MLDILRFSLNVGGYLFLGPSEGLASLKLDLITLNQTWKIFKKTKPSEYPQISTTLFHKPFAVDLPLPAPNLNPTGSLPLYAYNAIIQEVVSAGFIIDPSYVVLHSIGNARELILLPEGTPSLILPKIIIDELKVALIAALHQAKIKLIPVVYDHIAIPLKNGKEQSIKMSVHPVFDKNQTITYYWIRLDPVYFGLSRTPISETLEHSKRFCSNTHYGFSRTVISVLPEHSKRFTRTPITV